MIEDLNTTNILLGIMAAVSVLQTLVLIGVVVLALRRYRETLQTIREPREALAIQLAACTACTSFSKYHHQESGWGQGSSWLIFGGTSTLGASKEGVGCTSDNLFGIGHEAI